MAASLRVSLTCPAHHVSFVGVSARTLWIRRLQCWASRTAARSLFGADIGVSTTGVAGPGPADGFEAGTVHIACAHPAGEEHRLLRLQGDRAAVRAGAIDAALLLVRDVLDFAGAQVGD